MFVLLSVCTYLGDACKHKANFCSLWWAAPTKWLEILSRPDSCAHETSVASLIFQPFTGSLPPWHLLWGARPFPWLRFHLPSPTAVSPGLLLGESSPRAPSLLQTPPDNCWLKNWQRSSCWSVLTACCLVLSHCFLASLHLLRLSSDVSALPSAAWSVNQGESLEKSTCRRKALCDCCRCSSPASPFKPESIPSTWVHRLLFCLGNAPDTRRRGTFPSLICFHVN